MRQQLLLHPDSRSVAVTSIGVEIACPRANRLELSYIVSGQINGVRMPPNTTSARTDGLWRHTCFEAFVRAPAGTEYYELNFSPSGQWAAYQFSSYRNGRHVVGNISEIPIVLRSSLDRCVLQASLDPDRLTGLPRNHAWHLGLSAVIEDTNGSLSYWALVHPPGKPDFHHADCFACEFSSAAML
jgi:hypothetical protein